MTTPTTPTTPATPATTPAERRDRFRTLHESGTFLIPNPYDVGTARLLTALGFEALATTSSGFAATLGRLDMRVDREELVTHTRAIAASTHLPLNVDAERCFGDDPAGVAETVELLAEAGAAGVSIEDWNPATGAIDPIGISTARVAAAAEAAKRHGVVLTARCENHLHGVDDLDDTLNRLRAYHAAGAEVLYAPSLPNPAAIDAVVAIGAPVNVLYSPTGPSVPELAGAGVRRVSVGGLLARVALGAIAQAATGLLTAGRMPDTTPLIGRELLVAAMTL